MSRNVTFRLAVPRLLLIATAIPLGWGAGCSPSTDGVDRLAGQSVAEKGSRPLIRIAAASDLQRVLPSLVERFQSRTNSVTTLTFGSSGQLAEQIRAGAPFDVFLSANQAFVSDLARDGAIRSDSIKPYAVGSLVLVIPREKELRIKSLADLAASDIRKIAIANPAHAPYGQAAKQALEKSGLWSKVESRIVLAESVRQALNYAQQGHVDAALVGRAIADVPELTAIPVDPSLYSPLLQALGINSRTQLPEQAQKFAEFVLGAEGQEILRGHGFRSASLTGDSR